MDVDVRVARVAEIDPLTLYGILRLRADVFVVEQACAYLDPDGRDIEPGTYLLWVEAGGEVVATLRVLAEAGGAHRIGRVATARSHRRRGLANRLTERALDLTGADVVLDAQRDVVPFYERFGFRVDGDEFVEDGIPHVPMRRP